MPKQCVQYGPSSVSAHMPGVPFKSQGATVYIGVPFKPQGVTVYISKHLVDLP